MWPREISLVEIALLLWIGVEAMRGGGLSPRRMPASGKWMALLILGLAVWAAILWLVGLDWRYNLNEVRWLLLSVPAFALLLSSSKQEIGRRLTIVLAIAVVAALVADFQGVTGAFPPPFAEFSTKERWLSSDLAVERTVAVGLFRHSNMYGGFIFWPLMISIGGVMQKGKRWAWALGVVFFGASLYLSYYRGLLIGLGMAVAAFTLIMVPLPRRLVSAGLVALPILIILASVFGYALKPSAAFFETLRFRINLWQDVLNYIRSDPWILAFGAGYHSGSAFQLSQARADPHNVYLYMLMHYGLPGVLILVAMMGQAVLLGWRAYVRGAMTQRPILAALWAGLLAWFVTSL
ncbi:MAG: O-antigen ligase family protein, partial [Chloroflexi bacterium]|nr:O-antigen ligase family protein [Chloroflexota bacterium]